MKRGFYTIMSAQFFSSLADNALFVAAVELLRRYDAFVGKRILIAGSHDLALRTALLAKEMKQDLMTAEGAMRYGAMRGARGPVDTFYCGPDSELRTNCLAETGLPAPKQPVWRSQRSTAAA